MDELHTTLQCGRCKQTKADEEFPLRTTAAADRRGRDFTCRDCKAAYYRANKAKMPLQTRAANIKRRYGLTPEAYESLVSTGCGACGTTDRRIVLDHCHATGKVRGPLCDRCNGILGRAQDDPELLRNLAAHLEA